MTTFLIRHSTCPIVPRQAPFVIDPAVRNLVRQWAGERCEYRRLPESAVDIPFHVEHVIAKQHGGDDDASNLGLACDRCNLYKGPNLSSVDPRTQATVTLFHPRQHTWRDHFRCARDRITL
ncbi:MAG: HNH endonuclease [Acidobacteria bacterium]|nr:MAG: HNH endonuclease [Acidobacteriota bacterium]